MLLYVFAPISAAFVHVLLSPKRELHADALAARATGAAHDLADALMRLDRAAELVEFAASPATEPLYTVDPVRAARASHGCSRRTRRSTTRVRRLRELGAGPNGRVPRVVTLEARQVAARTSRVANAAVRVPEVRAQDAFALEADLLGDALRRDVVRIGHQIDPLELELVEPMPSEQPTARGADASPTCGCARPSSRSSRGSPES